MTRHEAGIDVVDAAGRIADRHRHGLASKEIGWLSHSVEGGEREKAAEGGESNSSSPDQVVSPIMLDALLHRVPATLPHVSGCIKHGGLA
jgi:hypothetical protein